MKVIFGCDPNAADLKRTLMETARSLGCEVVDLGSTDPLPKPSLRAKVTGAFFSAAPASACLWPPTRSRALMRR